MKFHGVDVLSLKQQVAKILTHIPCGFPVFVAKPSKLLSQTTMLITSDFDQTGYLLVVRLSVESKLVGSTTFRTSSVRVQNG